MIASHIVPAGVSDERLSDYAFRVFTVIPSRNGIKKAIKRGEILVDGLPAETGRWVRPGQRIELIEPEGGTPAVYMMQLHVVYEDGHLAVINKPPGVAVNGNLFKTVEHALRGNLAPSGEPDALRRPAPVHRLDRATGGLLLVAKTVSARIELGRQFEEREIVKRYRAVVTGRITEGGTISRSIDGREAVTRFEPVRAVPSLRSGWLTLVDLFPQTGRTHQLRRHMAETGFPILGDAAYGAKGMVLKSKGLFLCAVGLAFRHPVSGAPVELSIGDPPKFTTFLEREIRRWEKYHGPWHESAPRRP